MGLQVQRIICMNLTQPLTKLTSVYTKLISKLTCLSTSVSQRLVVLSK